MVRKKTIIVLLLCLIMFSTGAVAAVFADNETPVPSVYCTENINVSRGNGFYIYVYAKGFLNVAGLDLYVYYDNSVFTLGSVNKGSMLNGTLCDVNAENGGTICMSMVDTNGINGNGTLIYILFYAKSSVAEGRYGITVAVGDCYNKELVAVELAAGDCYVNVTKAPEQTKQVYFYSKSSAMQAQKGDSFDVTFYVNNSYGFATANFELEYDNALLRLENAAFGSSLTSVNGAVYSVNSNVAGYISGAYAALSEVPSSLPQAFVASFTVIGDADAQTNILFKATGLYNSQLEAYKGNACEISIELHKLPEIIVNTKVFVRSSFTGERLFAVQIVANAKSCIAAGDFYLNYNKDVLECVEIKSAASGCMVVGNPEFADGQARFSFISENGISEETVLAEVYFETAADCGTVFEFSVQGKNISDINFNGVVVDYVGGSVTLQHLFGEYLIDKQPTCLDAGIESQHCQYCAVKNTPRVVNALGHAMGEWQVTKEPTYLEVGAERRGCSRCDYFETRIIPVIGHEHSIKTVEENRVEPTCLTEGSFECVEYCTTCGIELKRKNKVIAKLGHDLILHNGKAPTCTENGWFEYNTCSRCDYTTFAEIAAKGHNPTAREENRVEPTCLTEGSFECVECCTTCGVELKRENKVIAKLGHDLILHNGKAPTCTENGWFEYNTCSRCDYTTFAEIAAKGHIEAVDALVEPTCTQTGLTEGKHCSVCNEALVAQKVIVQKEHSESDWIIDTVANCTGEGSKYKKCIMCGKVLTTDIVPATGHMFGKWITVKDSENGIENTSRICEVCGFEDVAQEFDGVVGCFGSLVTTDSSMVFVLLPAMLAYIVKKKRKL